MDMIESEYGKALDVLFDLLKNSQCPCGGWTCPRCLVTIDEAKQILPICETCNGDKEITEDVAQAGDQTLTETYTCPDCGGLGVST